MKKNIIALAVASAIAAPVAMADAPVVYGKINVNVNATDDKDASVNSTASRLGIKGSDDLGNGLKAVYKMEFSVDVAEKGKGSLGGRNQYLGLAGGFGTVLMGRHDTPLKMSQPSDLFNDGAADLGNVNMTAGVEVAEARAGDVLLYVSPSFSGVKLMAATVMGAGKTSDTKAVYDDATSVALTYGSTKKGLYLAAANASAKLSASSTGNTNRFSAQYKTGGLIVNAVYADTDISGSTGTTDEGTVTALQAAYKIGKFMPKVKVSMTESEAATDNKTTNTAIGLNYSLGKKTTAYIYAVDADKKNTAADAKGKTAADAVIFGMVHKF
jgi:predicted porin